MDEDFIYIRTPLGFVKISSTEKGISELGFCDTEVKPSIEIRGLKLECKKQLEQYFLGTRVNFELPLDLVGTDFQQRVWNKLLEIPYGKTWSYKILAEKLGDTALVRAAAQANASNPLAILIPCHRVIGSNHELRGYAGGVWRKRFLLDREQGIYQTSLF